MTRTAFGATSRVAKFSLLKTKLQIPTLRYPTIPRPQLLARLQSDQAVIVLTAPIGSGKTTLLVEWALWSSDAVAWLTLDELDNDLDRFLAYLIAAADGEDRLDGCGHAPLDATITAISTTLAQAPLTLVLDNYHLITNAAIHEAVTFLIDHLPPYSRLIIAGRTYPPLPLVRLRVSGQLGQIDDLNLNQTEIAQFLEASDERSLVLADRTEGWIAGLKLAKLWLKGGADPRGFGAGYRHVYDYFMQEVFAPQPTPLQNFLLITSILDPLCADLCNAVTGQSGGQVMLERLEQLNLFIRPLDDTRSRYRYHPLFGEFLRECLSRQGMGDMSGLHLRASVWHERSGNLPAAIEHALEAHAWERAGALIERCRVGGISVEGWLSRLPEDVRLAQAVLVEALSEREAEVLHLISSGMSNPEIASRLIIAVSTVKTHVKNIYRKLDVDTRYQAMERARDLNLIQLRMEHDFRKMIK
ncbi:MAG: LuxR C-terminal-related transcriptional regulator [Chloroflexota bacterium]